MNPKNTPLNICHFIASKGLGRGEFYVDLINELSLIENTKLTLLVPQGAKFLDRVFSGVSVVEYRAKGSRYSLFLLMELFFFFRKNRFNIVHTHFAKSSEIFFLLNKFLKLPHLATKHNPRKGKIFNKIKYVTTVSKDAAKTIVNPNVKIIYNGLNPVKINPKVSQNSHFKIVAIGRLEKIKGFDTLIEEVAKIEHDFSLSIVGEGKEREKLARLIDELSLQDRVFLVGFRKDIPKIISEADLVAISSLSEGFSMVALEALFYSPLLISSRVGICQEILPETFLPTLDNFGSKINDIISRYDFYKNEFLKTKNEYQPKFLLPNIAKEYHEYYKEIIKTKEA